MYEGDVLQEKIKEYKESLKKERPELDIALLFRILDLMNESSEVKVAIDPVKGDGEWSSDAPTYAVVGVTTLEDGRVALKVRDERHAMEAGDLYVKLKKVFKRKNVEKVPVLYVKNETVTQLTDAYSHALVQQKWGGMPFDLVLAVKSESQDEEAE